jgi:hypothetical protein
MVKLRPTISIPTKIKVGSTDIFVRLYDGLVTIANDEGSYDETKQIILLDKEIAERSNSYSVLVLMHEISHVIYNQHLMKEATEEVVVNGFSHSFTSILKDNPNLLTWINRCVK